MFITVNQSLLRVRSPPPFPMLLQGQFQPLPFLAQALPRPVPQLSRLPGNQGAHLVG